MDSQSKDRIIWLCLGITLFFAARGISAELHRVKKLTEIQSVDKEDHVIGEGTEDAIKIETLQKLSDSPSFDLRSAALRIVSERATKGSARDLLLEDLSSKDPTRRGKALNALHFLASNRALSRSAASSRLRDVETFTALVDCLCNFLEEHTEETGTTISPILPKTRPLGEKKALVTLNLMLPDNIPAAIEAGVVSRWLARYPFPCAARGKARRLNVVKLARMWWTDDPVMCSIITTLYKNADGVKYLRRAGLMGSRWTQGVPDSYYGIGFGQANEAPTYGVSSSDGEEGTQYYGSDSDDDDDGAPGPFVPGRRQQEGSAEEQALRRRRREAMVFSEGGRPLGSEDIIQPVQNDGRDDSDERERELDRLMEDLNEEVDREDALSETASQEPRSHGGWQFRFWPF